MKVVLDTNCILQIVFPKACYKEAWDALLANIYTICVSNEILLEYREILERRFKDARFAENELTGGQTPCEVKTPYPSSPAQHGNTPCAGDFRV